MTATASMGLIQAEIELVNAFDEELVRRNIIAADEVRRAQTLALVDTGAYYLCITPRIREQLDLPYLREEIAELADGQVKQVQVYGPVRVEFQNRSTSCDAFVFSGFDEVLLGAIPMEGLDVVLNPKKQTIEVNPKSPDIATHKCKSLRQPFSPFFYHE